MRIVAIALVGIALCGCSSNNSQATGDPASRQALDFSSPQSTFATFKKAAAASDIRLALDCLTPNGVDCLAEGEIAKCMGSIKMAIMMGDDPAKETSPEFLAVYKKQGLEILSLAKETKLDEASFIEIASKLKNKRVFIEDMARLYQGSGSSLWLFKLADAEIRDIKISGGEALASLYRPASPDEGSTPIDFRKIDNRWLLHIERGGKAKPPAPKL